MNVVPKIIFNWPEMPALPPSGRAVLIRVVTSQPRQAARQELRGVLRQVLATWSRLSPESLPLRETARGPVWLGQLGGHTLDISLSYAEGEGWIGLLRSGWIGVDAMKIQTIPEAENVARHYLATEIWEMIQQSADPATAFAVAWTELEARFKCFKQELIEWPATQTFVEKKCDVQTIVLPDRVAVSIATAAKNSHG